MKTNLTKLYANKENNPNIIGRESEINNVFITLLRREKPNCLLVSEPGVGKTAIAHQLAYLIANKKCPKALEGFQVIEINTNALIAGPGYRGVTEEKFQTMIDESLRHGKTVLFFDEFHTVESLGQMANGQTPGLGNTLKPYLTRSDFRVIGATTYDEFSDIKDKALLRRFFVQNVAEPNDKALLAITRQCMKNYGEGLKFKKEIPRLFVDLSASLDGQNPDKVKDVIDVVCAKAKMVEQKSINSSFVNETFGEFFSKSKTESGS